MFLCLATHYLLDFWQDEFDKNGMNAPTVLNRDDIIPFVAWRTLQNVSHLTAMLTMGTGASNSFYVP